MKILLIGEYNSLHRFLKDGLIKLGHEAIVIGLNDGFKKVDVDIEIFNYFETNWFLKLLRKLVQKLFKIDLYSISVWQQIKKLKIQLSGYDIVQFINETPFQCTASVETKIFNLLLNNNKKLFLSSCGDDHISISYADKQIPRYSILSPYFDNKVSKEHFSYSYKYLKPEFKKLHQHIFKHINGVIASDLDYHFPLKNHPKYLGMIPNPIKLDEFIYQKPVIEDKIIIFHGINSHNYLKKGNDIFEEALDIVSKKHQHKIVIITVRSLPYKEYINTYSKAHILLDQIYAYDQGFNALEAMAKGKVVFTGAEKEWLNWYDLDENTIAVNALPNAQDIADKLEWLILNPNIIIDISKNAREFIEKEHDYIQSAECYLNKWLNN
jgi:glycosyltransferase involved in cell wall biosynthesis